MRGGMRAERRTNEYGYTPIAVGLFLLLPLFSPIHTSRYRRQQHVIKDARAIVEFTTLETTSPTSCSGPASVRRRRVPLTLSRLLGGPLKSPNRGHTRGRSRYTGKTEEEEAAAAAAAAGGEEARARDARSRAFQARGTAEKTARRER